MRYERTRTDEQKIAYMRDRLVGEEFDRRVAEAQREVWISRIKRGVLCLAGAGVLVMVSWLLNR